MNLPIHPSIQVLVGIPGSTQAPTLAILSDIASARRAGQLPAMAMVQLGPNEPWLPVDVVLARAGLLVDTTMPTRPLLVALLVVPPI